MRPAARKAFLLSAAFVVSVVFTSRTLTQAAPAVPAKPAPEQLSPGAAYREAIQPIEITHRVIGNWSPIEQSSLAVAIANGKAACDARKTSDYTADALMDLAQLCALGINWPAVLESTDHYIREPSPTPKARLAEAYAGRVDAWLNIKNEKQAFADAQTLLALTPYSALAAQASSEAIDYMRFLYPADALTLAAQRTQVILPALQAKSTIPLPDLYNQALALAELQQLQANRDLANKTFAALESALPADIAPDDSIAIASLRRRYTLLGNPLPASAPHLQAANQITALLLFPDWCAQCIRLALQTPQGPFTVEGHTARMIPLLVQTVPPQKLPTKPAQQQSETFNPAYAADYLKTVAPIIVPPSTLGTFEASDFPLLILVDRQGNIRLMDVVDENALRPGNVVDSAIALIGKPTLSH